MINLVAIKAEVKKVVDKVKAFVKTLNVKKIVDYAKTHRKEVCEVLVVVLVIGFFVVHAPARKPKTGCALTRPTAVITVTKCGKCAAQKEAVKPAVKPVVKSKARAIRNHDRQRIHS